MFQITPEAARQIEDQSKASNAEEMVLRIAAKTNQDGSFEYGMGFDEVKEHDFKMNLHGIVIVIDPQSHELLEDATLDFVEIEPGQFNFIFMNPLDPNYSPVKKSQK